VFSASAVQYDFRADGQKKIGGGQMHKRIVHVVVAAVSAVHCLRALFARRRGELFQSV
jgi:hypothetical protein